jgi:hypothetical protein
MSADAKSGPSGSWEKKLHDAGVRVEEDLRKVIEFINDEVVPDVRRNGSVALKAAAKELQKLAERMDERAKHTPPGGSPKDGTK